VFEVRKGSTHEIGFLGIPNKVLNTDVRPANQDQVEGIRLGPGACGNAGAGLNHERGAMGDLVAAGSRSGERNMRVTGQVQIRFAGGKGGDHVFGSADEMFVMNGLREVEGVVRDENLDDPRIDIAEETPSMLDLPITDTAAGASE
jgi:hypothetical protein